MRVKVVFVDGRAFPVVRTLDGVEFYLAFDDDGSPFYTDRRPN